MSDELREYAHRIVDCVSKSDYDFGRTYQRDTEKQGFGLLEPYELAVARLAEHRADSDTPIDNDWLLSLGSEANATYYFTLPGETHQGHRVQLIRVSTGYSVKLIDKRLVEGLIIACLKTRRDLRRLCEALGIKLKEQG